MSDLRAPFIRFKNKSPQELFKGVRTPFYAIDEMMLKRNGMIIKDICDRTGAKILLALKCFSNFNLFPLLSNYISGTEASGLFEARLGKEEMPGKEVHVFCAGFREDEIEEILEYADHIVFNSVNQLKKYGPLAKSKNKSIGVRVNPEFSTQIGHDIYDPCSKGSRLGITLDQWNNYMTDELISLLDGIHFHTLCQQNSDDLEKTLYAVEEKFGKYFSNLKWINFGGGHHLVREDYDIDRLIKCINYVKNKYHLDVYLEPGEGVVLNAGYLVSSIVDTFKSNGMLFAIHDTSAACHMPDVIEMPYLPPLYESDSEGSQYTYHFGGPTCLSGDSTGIYNMPRELHEGDMIVFGDMALYTMAKNNTFNGMPLPNIYILHEDDSLEKLTDFGYKDFKYRLGKMHNK